MKNIASLCILLTVLFSGCEDSEPSSETLSDFAVDNKTFVISSYILNDAEDLNGDVVYSFDIFDEGPLCSTSYTISFVSEKTPHPG